MSGPTPPNFGFNIDGPGYGQEQPPEPPKIPGYYQQPPSQPGNYQQPPQQPGFYQQPGYYQQPPQQPGNYQQPSQQPGFYQQPPQQPGSYQQPPQQPGNYQQPSQQPGFYQQPPQQPGSYQQPPQQAGNYQQGSQVQSIEQQFRQLMQKYQINADFASRLQCLHGFKIVFIFDDSSSMNSQLSESPLNQPGQSSRVTRWNELEYFASIAVELANLFDKSGCDVHFLNRQPALRKIRNTNELLDIFSPMKPNGYTPLTRALDTVLRENAQIVGYEKKLLVIIVTDGEPTDLTGHSDINGFKQCLKSRHPADRIFTSIIACTDQPDSMDYLNKLDRTIKNLDVVDDYRSERQEVLRNAGRHRGAPMAGFSYGDYVCKCLIGSVDKSIDRTDEQQGNQNKDCIIS